MRRVANMPMATTTVEYPPVILQYNIDTTVDPSYFSQLVSIQGRRRVLTVVNNSRQVDIAVYSGNIRDASKLLRVVPPMSTGTVLIPTSEDRCLLSGIRSMTPQASGILGLLDNHIATGETVVAVLSDRRLLEDSSHSFFSTTPPSRQPDTFFGPLYGTLDSHLIQPMTNNRISPDGGEGMAFVGVNSHPVLSQNLGLSYLSDPEDPDLMAGRSQWSYRTRDIELRNITTGPRTATFIGPEYGFLLTAAQLMLVVNSVPSGGTLQLVISNLVGNPTKTPQAAATAPGLGVGSHIHNVLRTGAIFGPRWRITVLHSHAGTYDYTLDMIGTGV